MFNQKDTSLTNSTIVKTDHPNTDSVSTLAETAILLPLPATESASNHVPSSNTERRKRKSIITRVICIGAIYGVKMTKGCTAKLLQNNLK